MKKVKDYYFKKAKQEGYAARSVYKLKEAEKKFKFLRPGYNILDLGAAPGAWSKYAGQVVGNKGKVLAVDIKKFNPPMDNVQVLTCDVFDLISTGLLRTVRSFNVVLSDMAPKTTGRKDVDHLKSISLAEMALEISTNVLIPSGYFFCKVFEGSDLPAFRAKCLDHFHSVKVFKPKSSRSESVEIFIFAKKLKI